MKKKKNLHSIPALDQLDKDLEIFHIQRFEELSKENYWKILNQKKNKIKPSEKDLEETREIAKLLFSIHNSTPNLGDSETKDKLYNDGLCSIFTAQDLFFFFLHTFDKNHPFFPPSKHGEYTAEMLKLFHKFKNNGKRIRSLHGDFWGSNVFKKEHGDWYAVDYSRIPFGEPGVDVSCWIGQYLWLYHETKNDIYKILGEEFINHYTKISGDKNINKFFILPLGLWSLIWVSPLFYPERKDVRAKSFFKTIQKILKSEKFSWE